jgi:hypothetical protein
MPRGPITARALARDLREAWPAIVAPDPLALEQRLICRLELVQRAAAELRRRNPDIVAERSVAAIRLIQLARESIERWQLTDEQTASVLRLSLAGQPLAQIARELGRSREHLSRAVMPRAVELLATVILRLGRADDQTITDMLTRPPG